MRSVAAPLPPPDIHGRKPFIDTIGPGATLHRFFSSDLNPFYFARSRDGRFNAPDGSYGVLYAARTREGAFAETFLRMPGRTYIPLDLLSARGYARFETTRAVRLVRLAGPGLARVGATAEVCHRSRPYAVPQAWSKALHEHPTMADGIAYTARHDDEAPCIALFDRAADALTEVHREVDLDQDWFWRLAEGYGIGTPPT